MNDNCYKPTYMMSMESNSEHLSKHLMSILQLDSRHAISPSNYRCDCISDEDILDQSTLHDLPIFVSIDGSKNDDETATVSISIVAPDIREADVAQEWEDRIAKVMLIRSWRLPSTWGNSSVCINMAESIGFIIGEYTIPAELPVIYITDSNNARTLQQSIASLKKFTHRKQVRHVKQGMDQSIASHLEYLTKKWPAQNELTPYQQHLYKRGERVCQIWAAANQHHTNQQSNHLCSGDHSSTSSNSTCSSYSTKNTTPHECHL